MSRLVVVDRRSAVELHSVGCRCGWFGMVEWMEAGHDARTRPRLVCSRRELEEAIQNHSADAHHTAHTAAVRFLFEVNSRHLVSISRAAPDLIWIIRKVSQN